MILACDGIWDCYDNQAAVDFVRERLGQGFTPAQVAEAMFDDCLAEDPQRSSGVGTDNMTCLIVCFKKGFLESSSATPGA
jgi:serine/threonine protein phosphatase PrpC